MKLNYASGEELSAEVPASGDKPANSRPVPRTGKRG